MTLENGVKSFLQLLSEAREGFQFGRKELELGVELINVNFFMFIKIRIYHKFMLR